MSANVRFLPTEEEESDEDQPLMSEIASGSLVPRHYIVYALALLGIVGGAFGIEYVSWSSVGVPPNPPPPVEVGRPPMKTSLLATPDSKTVARSGPIDVRQDVVAQLLRRDRRRTRRRDRRAAAVNRNQPRRGPKQSHMPAEPYEAAHNASGVKSGSCAIHGYMQARGARKVGQPTPVRGCCVPCIFTSGPYMARGRNKLADAAKIKVYEKGSPAPRGEYSIGLTLESQTNTHFLKNGGYKYIAMPDKRADFPTLAFPFKNGLKDASNARAPPFQLPAATFMASNCASTRAAQVSAIARRFPVVAMGSCKPPGTLKPNMTMLRQQNNLRGSRVANKVKAIKQYMFHLSYENSVHEGYMTEKIIDALQAHTIPIYYGAPDAKDFLPHNSFLKHEKSAEELATKLHALAADPERRAQMHAWRANYPGFTPPPGYMCVGCMLCNACRRYAQEVQHRTLSAECKAETFVDAKWQRKKWTPERAAQEDCGSAS